MSADFEEAARISLPTYATLGAWPTVRLGDNDLCAGYVHPFEARGETDWSDLFLPTVDVWLAAPEGARVLPELLEGGFVTTEPSIREDYDGLVVRVHSDGLDGTGFEFALPSALVFITASAACRNHVPLYVAVRLAAGIIDPMWWIRTPTGRPDFICALAAEDVRRSTWGVAGRSIDLPPAADYFEPEAQ
jgi:hypothetical protein